MTGILVSSLGGKERSKMSETKEDRRVGERRGYQGQFRSKVLSLEAGEGVGGEPQSRQEWIGNGRHQAWAIDNWAAGASERAFPANGSGSARAGPGAPPVPTSVAGVVLPLGWCCDRAFLHQACPPSPGMRYPHVPPYLHGRSRVEPSPVIFSGPSAALAIASAGT